VTPWCNVAGSCKNSNFDEVFKVWTPSIRKKNVEQNIELADLVTEALPTTSWHKYETVLIIHCSPASFILQRPEAFVAKDDNISKVDII